LTNGQHVSSVSSGYVHMHGNTNYLILCNVNEVPPLYMLIKLG